MSTRERWTVYPLLFLTLGIALKDKLNRTITTDTLVCENVVVVDRDQSPMAELFSTPGGGVLKTMARDDGLTISLGSFPRVSGLFVADRNGNLLPSTVLVRRGRGAPAAPAKTGSPNGKAEPRKKPAPPSDP